MAGRHPKSTTNRLMHMGGMDYDIASHLVKEYWSILQELYRGNQEPFIEYFILRRLDDTHTCTACCETFDGSVSDHITKCHPAKTPRYDFYCFCCLRQVRGGEYPSKHSSFAEKYRFCPPGHSKLNDAFWNPPGCENRIVGPDMDLLLATDVGVSRCSHGGSVAYLVALGEPFYSAIHGQGTAL